MRSVFELGKEYKYPREMLRHHYSDIPEKYFNMVEKPPVASESEDNSYSDDFAQNKPTSSEFTKNSGQNNEQHESQLQLEVDVTNPNIFEKSPPKSTIDDKVLSEDDQQRLPQMQLGSYTDNVRNQATFQS